MILLFAAIAIICFFAIFAISAIYADAVSSYYCFRYYAITLFAAFHYADAITIIFIIDFHCDFSPLFFHAFDYAIAITMLSCHAT